MDKPYEYPIGIFDSGLGGLTVLRAIRDALPKENLIYFGDTARVPYGNRSHSIVVEYSKEIANFLVDKKVKCIVVACNTASAHALDFLKKYCSVPVYGVIQPAVNFFIEEFSQISNVAIIATKSTIQSNVYKKEILKRNASIHIYQQPCPLLVPITEEGMHTSPIAKEVIRMYFKEIIKKDILHIILGCTHYPLLKESILSLYPNARLIDSSIALASHLKKELSQKNLLGIKKEVPNSNITLYVSDITEHLVQFQKVFFDDENCKLEKITL